MAFEADKVVVQLVADTQGFDAQAKQSAQNFSTAMNQVTSASKGAEAAANDVYTAHNKLGIATNNARIAQFELQHVVRGSVDQFAAGASASTIFAQHIASVAEAASFMGGSLGKVGEIMAGPWGLAITAGVAVVATLIAKHHEEGDTLDSLVEKLQKHHDQTELNAKANDIWSHSIDGVIESEKRLADELDKSLTIQSVAQRQALENAQSLVALRGLQLAKAEDQFNVGDPRLTKAQQAFHEAIRILQDDMLKFGQQEGEALSDLTARSNQWADKQQQIIRNLQGVHPELTQFGGDVNAAFDQLKKAVADAASANVPFDGVTRQVDALNSRLAQSPEFIQDYIKQLKAMAAQLEATVQTAKDAPKAIDDFKKAVIGAEGTGPNRLGSSAAGFGQFMPSTFESYFKQLFPAQAAAMTNEQIDALRNKRQIVEAVLSAATDDYVKVLKAAGQQITEAALYTVHLLGASDARKFFAAAPGTDTSSFLSAGVLAGNPFLRGTVSQASAAIAQRIGGSNAAVSQGATALQETLNKEIEEEAKQHEHVLDLLSKEADVSKDITEEAGKQNNVFVQMPKDISAAASAEAQLKDRVKQTAQEMDDAKRIGAALVDDVLNPDNWNNWGDAAKRVLHDILAQLFTLAAINPLKNLLFGGDLPTLGGVLGSLFGGAQFDSQAFGAMVSSNEAALGLPSGFFPRAGGGPVTAGVPYVVGEDGPETFVPQQSGMIIPNNGSAASPLAAAQSMVSILIEASPYFDGRVMDVAGPAIASASVRATQGGSALARDTLARRQLHYLG